MSNTVDRQSRYRDGTYLERNPGWHAEGSLWKAEHIDQIMRKNGISPQTICEIGCGAGGVLSALQEKRQDASFVGYDISPQAFELCKKKANDRLSFHMANLLEQEGVFFDMILAIDVFEHVEDYMGFLSRLRSKASYKIFHIPLDLSAQALLRESAFVTAREKVGHLHYFTKYTALATLIDCGYRIIDWTYTRKGIDLPNQGWKTSLMSVPRRALFVLSPNFAVHLLGGFSLLVLAA
jgi:SAM-dependent methyltransferase